MSPEVLADWYRCGVCLHGTGQVFPAIAHAGDCYPGRARPVAPAAAPRQLDLFGASR